MGGSYRKDNIMSYAAGLAMKAASGLTNGLISGVSNAAKYVGAGERANAVSAAAQAAAGNFNQASANNANAINTQTLANQYAFNSGGANLANDYTTGSWNQAAAWNEEMFEKQMAFNAEQAQLQRDWAERMDNTKYQRAMADMKAGGLNPILAYGGINSSASGSAASVSAPQMGFAHGAQATGGLLGANDASISGYTGQMEYYAGLMGMLSSMFGGLNSAFKSFANMPSDLMKGTADLIGKFIDSNSNGKILGVDMTKEAQKTYKEEKKNGVKFEYTNKGLFHDNNKMY